MTMVRKRKLMLLAALTAATTAPWMLSYAGLRPLSQAAPHIAPRLDKAALAQGSAVTAPSGFSPVVARQDYGLSPAQQAQILALHNAERARLGKRALRWDDSLAAHAQVWARRLAATQSFEHSPQDMRGNEGENLFMGTAGYYPVQAMVGSFLEERADFVPGTFPHVAARGSWHDVGHYTQIIWPATRGVGCAMARGGTGRRGNDYLVCRYNPAGNVFGQTVP